MTFRMQKKWHWLVALGAVFVPGIVTGALSLPFTFAPGKPIRASEVNANFEALRAQIDGLSGSAARPVIGTLTLAGVVSQTPIRKFSESISTPWPRAAGAAPKPALSDIVVVRDVSDGTPQLNLALEQGQLITSADIALGSLTIHLTGVVLTHVTVGETRSDHAQETIGFSYKSVTWSWQIPGGVKRTISFDKTSGAGGAAATAFKYGYFASGVTPDATLVPVMGYTHDVACPSPTAVCNNGAFAVQKAVGSETIDELGGAASGVAGGGVDLQWFLTAASASNSVKLTNTVVASVELSTKDDGSLLENVSFGYVQITWRAGIAETAWDVSKNAAP